MRNALFILALIICGGINAQCYSVSQIAYQQDTSTVQHSAFSMYDDQWSAAVPIGFPFCFYGAEYDSLLIGTNGMVTFDLDTANEYCPWPIQNTAMPSAAFPPNVIMGTWCDLSFTGFPLVHIIHWWQAGVAPNRVLVVLYDSLSMNQFPALHYSGRIILREASNAFEVQIDSKDISSWNQGRAVVGAQNQTTSMAIHAPLRGPTSTGWSAQQEGWLFTPTCDVCSGVGVVDETNANQFDVYPNPSNGNFTLQIQNTNSTIASYDVVDISGRVVRCGQVNSQQQIQFTLVNSGMYFIRVYDEANTMLKSEKVVVE